jgi:hypothetical protein
VNILEELKFAQTNVPSAPVTTYFYFFRGVGCGGQRSDLCSWCFLRRNLEFGLVI